MHTHVELSKLVSPLPGRMLFFSAPDVVLSNSESCGPKKSRGGIQDGGGSTGLLLHGGQSRDLVPGGVPPEASCTVQISGIYTKVEQGVPCSLADRKYVAAEVETLRLEVVKYKFQTGF